jgi:hypothetical protein
MPKPTIKQTEIVIEHYGKMYKSELAALAGITFYQLEPIRKYYKLKSSIRGSMNKKPVSFENKLVRIYGTVPRKNFHKAQQDVNKLLKTYR